jgi:hypothetical protein
MPLLWLDALAEADRRRAGAKAWALARMRRAGLPVPDGFVVPADGPEPEPAALEEACRRLGAVAVRSSASAEDSAEASFAGQFRTELDLRGSDVRDAVRRCQAATADAYAGLMGAGTASERIPVLVQSFVEPRWAGVVFTRDPRDASRMVVESHAGRGEALVSGLVRPRRDLVDRATGEARKVSAESGTALADADLRAVADLARRAEALFGEPQDVEWAIGADGPVLLQSRPITVASSGARDPRIERLTRANVGEVLPDPVTPLTVSTLVAVLEHGFEEVARMAGLGETAGPPFLVIHGERLYLNLTRSLALAARLPGVSAADAESLVLGAGAGPPAPNLRLRDIPRLVGILARLAALGARLPRRIAQAEEDLRTLRARAAHAGRGAAELRAALGDFVSIGRTVATTHVAVSGASGVRLAIVQRLLARWLPGDPRARVNRLLAGLDGVESAAPAMALDTIAALVRSRPEWRAFVSQPRAAEAFTRGTAPPELAGHLRTFLDRFGHRALSEGELRARTWREDPSPVLQALATLAAGTRAPGFTHRAAAEQREAEEEAVFAGLGVVRGALLARALEGARDGVRARERTKSLAVAVVDEGRRLARMAGVLLTAAGRIGEEDDVFFLGVDELRATLDGISPSLPELRRRRRRFEAAADVPAPRVVDLRPGSTSPAAEPSWRGTGVSPGIGVGRARVVAAGEPVRLEPGEVLVAPVLDAALGPLLASAAGARDSAWSSTAPRARCGLFRTTRPTGRARTARSNRCRPRLPPTSHSIRSSRIHSRVRACTSTSRITRRGWCSCRRWGQGRGGAGRRCWPSAGPTGAFCSRWSDRRSSGDLRASASAMWRRGGGPCVCASRAGSPSTRRPASRRVPCPWWSPRARCSSGSTSASRPPRPRSTSPTACLRRSAKG